MKTQDRFKLLLAADAATLVAVDAALVGQAKPELPPLRLLRMSEVADRLNVSRQTVWRLRKENRIRTVTIRKGSCRVSEAELSRFVGGEQ